jgi:hypothetical protein
MKRSLVGGVAAAFVAAFFAAPIMGQFGGDGDSPAPGGPIPRMADGKPDMRGRWYGGARATNILEENPGGFGVRAGKSLVIDPPDGRFPYQPWALEERNRRRLAENSYDDPEGKCILAGVPRIMNFTFQLDQIDDQLVFWSDYVHHWRFIPMKPRPHLPDRIRLWMGDSVGRWEGDTFVVDIRNHNGKAWMGLGGDFYSDAAQMVERWTMLNANTLQYRITITDPKVYTRPVTLEYGPFTKSTQWLDEIEDSCHEGNASLVNMKRIQDRARAARGAKP